VAHSTNATACRPAGDLGHDRGDRVALDPRSDAFGRLHHHFPQLGWAHSTHQHLAVLHGGKQIWVVYRARVVVCPSGDDDSCPAASGLRQRDEGRHEADPFGGVNVSREDAFELIHHQQELRTLGLVAQRLPYDQVGMCRIIRQVVKKRSGGHIGQDRQAKHEFVQRTRPRRHQHRWPLS
jgi:hypothetical protein